MNDKDALLKNSNEANSKAVEKYESLTIELTDVSYTRDNLRSATESLAAMLESKEAEITSLGNTVQELTNQLRSHVTSQASSQIEHDAEVRELTRKIKELKNDTFHSMAQSADLKSKLKITEIETHSLIRDLDSYEKQLHDLSILLGNSEEALFQQTCKNQSLAAELSSVTASRYALRQEKESVVTELKSKDAEVSCLQDRIQVLTNQISLSDTDRNELSSKLTSMETQLESQHASLNLKAEENSSLLSELSALKIMFDNLVTETREAAAQSQTQIQAYNARQNELLSLVASKEVEISSSSSRNEDRAFTLTKLNCELESTEAQLRREKLAHEITRSHLLNERCDSENVSSGSKIKIDHLSSGLEATKAALSAKASELLKIHRKKECLANELESSVNEIKRKEDEFNSKVKDLSTLVTSQESEIQKRRASYANLEACFKAATDSKEKEICRIECKLSSAKDSIVSLHLVFEAQKGSLEVKIQQLEAEFLQQNENQAERDERLAALGNVLKSCEEKIQRLTAAWQLAQDEIVSLQAEVECVKEIGLHSLLSPRKEFEDKYEKERFALQIEWRDFQKKATRLVACIQGQREVAELPLGALPEMTSLLNTLFELFQAKIDQVSSLKAELKTFDALNADRSSQLEALVEEMK